MTDLFKGLSRIAYAPYVSKEELDRVLGPKETDVHDTPYIEWEEVDTTDDSEG